MNRILSAARLQLVGWPARLVWPWFILGLSFAVNFVLFHAIGRMITPDPVTGGLMSIYTVELIFCAQSITQLLPLALGLSMTRKSFYAAALLCVVVRSLAFGVALTIIKLVEDATHGWGISLHFFGLPFLAQDNPFLQLLCFAALFILLDVIGIFAGVVFKRWGVSGMLTLLSATILVAGGAVVLLTWQRQWQAMFDWFAGQSSFALTAAWPLALALVIAAGGFLAIRRATPA